MHIPPVFVISLPGSPRRDDIERQLASWPGEWSFVDGVDARALTPEQLKALYDESASVRRNGRPMAPPEVGCALSHRKAYGEILQRDVDYAIVLEDDVVLTEDFRKFPFLSLGLSFDVISFFASHGIAQKRGTTKIGGVTLHRAKSVVRMAVAYLISRDGARKLYEAAQGKITTFSDWPLTPDEIDFYVAMPFLVKHGDVESTTEDVRETLKKTPKRTRFEFLGRLTDGFWGYITIPLFVKYLLYRGYYRGPGDYFRREILYELRSMLPSYLKL